MGLVESYRRTLEVSLPLPRPLRLACAGWAAVCPSVGHACALSCRLVLMQQSFGAAVPAPSQRVRGAGKLASWYGVTHPSSA